MNHRLLVYELSRAQINLPTLVFCVFALSNTTPRAGQPSFKQTRADRIVGLLPTVATTLHYYAVHKDSR